MSTTWHADPASIARYVSDDLDDINASSLEAHILTCASCREALTAMTPTPQLDGMWQAIETVLSAPQPGFVEQVLLRLGVHEHVARLLAATPSLRLSWLAAEAFALATAAFAAQNTAGTSAGGAALFLFLVLAALAPVAESRLRSARASIPHTRSGSHRRCGPTACCSSEQRPC